MIGRTRPGQRRRIWVSLTVTIVLNAVSIKVAFAAPNTRIADFVGVCAYVSAVCLFVVLLVGKGDWVFRGMLLVINVAYLCLVTYAAVDLLRNFD
jgi:hypothetical protein